DAAILRAPVYLPFQVIEREAAVINRSLDGEVARDVNAKLHYPRLPAVQVFCGSLGTHSAVTCRDSQLIQQRLGFFLRFGSGQLAGFDEYVGLVPAFDR